MTFFESLLVLLLAAVVLLQVSRRLSLPYPAMLAGAGVLVALLPGTPTITIEPNTALALFIAPALVDSAFDFPPAAALRFLGPLITFAVFAVLATTVLVAWLAHTLIGLPIAAAVALGAIVAPPDAAAATAVLSAVSVPRSAEEVLKGESLFNDATALLLFSGALAVLSGGGFSVGVGLRVAAAIPGGLLLGFLAALAMRSVNRFVRDTLGGNLLQFVLAFLIWIAAERLQLSAVLCTIAFAMTLARTSEMKGFPRMRVQSYAVWSAVVFALNVFAFLIMGMQARAIVGAMPRAHLNEAMRFAAIVVVAVIVTRFAVVLGFDRLSALRSNIRGKQRPATLRKAVFLGWSGMRGFVTLATAFALPPSFPRRDVVVLTAFAVVLGTLVLQGLTLGPLIRLLHLDSNEEAMRELKTARAHLASVALHTLEHKPGAEAAMVRFSYSIERDAAQQGTESEAMSRWRASGLAAVAAERDGLEELRAQGKLGISAYGLLQEELDWRELTLLRDDQRRIEES